jgi:hypothetical protein
LEILLLNELGGTIMCVLKILAKGCSTNLEERLFVYVFFVLFVCIGGPMPKFLLLFDNLPMNCKTICLCFGHQFLLNYLMFVGCLAFIGCLVFFARVLLFNNFLQQCSYQHGSKGKLSTSFAFFCPQV